METKYVPQHKEGLLLAEHAGPCLLQQLQRDIGLLTDHGEVAEQLAASDSKHSKMPQVAYATSV